MNTVNEMQRPKTRFQEETFSTSDINRMKGMFLAERLLRKWDEKFADEDTGDVVSIERSELILERGTFLSNDAISQISFYLESGDIKEVQVSNQKRAGIVGRWTTSVWSAVASVNSKKRTYLFYANCLELAHRIIVDYLEQNVEGTFILNSIKEIDYSNLIPIEEDSDDLDFYSIELEVEYENQEAFQSSYILKSHDAETAKKSIMAFIAEKSKANGRNDACEVTIISAKKIKCYGIVDYNFSQQYFDNEQ